MNDVNDIGGPEGVPMKLQNDPGFTHVHKLLQG